jgi:hypothetical protein
MEPYFSFKFAQPQLSWMDMNTTVFHLWYSLLIKWSSTFQQGNSRLIEKMKYLYFLKEVLRNVQRTFIRKGGVSFCGVQGMMIVSVRLQVLAVGSMKMAVLCTTLCCVVRYKLADTSNTDNGGSKHFWNVGQFLPVVQEHYPRRYAIFRFVKSFIAAVRKGLDSR